ncbi:homeobox protein SIX1 [Mytilus galloprovincialis]|uniref:Homeobox protein SIX1 n=1 Tax=Mytilus galloprovincialis TaxID=29158 RepID=A0A8B6G1H4_MYTGA|nr:homeobox protein SIX1 [Mytilus galloprovincialis]
MTENYINLFERLSNTENDNFIEIVPLLGEVASTLIINCLFDEFGKILMNLDVSKLNILKDNEKFLRAMIAFYYEKKMYRQVFEMLATGKFSDNSGLIEIWDNAQYALKEEQVGKPLTSLMKFRTRQKYPPPTNISPGGRSTAKLSDQAKAVLKSWWSENSQNPYPTQATREEIANRAGLTHYQVKTWFANARRRQKMSAEKNQLNYELYMKKKRELLSKNGTQARTRNTKIDESSGSTEIHSTDNVNPHVSRPNLNESVSTNCIQNLTQLCRHIDSNADADISVYTDFQSRNPVSLNSGLQPFVNVQNNYHHAFRYQNIDDTRVSFGPENQLSQVPNYWPHVRNPVQKCAQVTDPCGINYIDGRNNIQMCNHSDNRQPSDLSNPRTVVIDQTFSNPVCSSQNKSPRVPTFTFQQENCATFDPDQSVIKTPMLISCAIDISNKGIIGSKHIKNSNDGLRVENGNSPMLLSRPSSCPLPTTEKLRYLLTSEHTTKSHYQIKEASYNRRYPEQPEKQIQTNYEIKQGNEENDIAKVLLDFSSQSVDSSQDSS